MTVAQPPKAVWTTIANGASLSGAFRTHNHVQGMVIVPSTWTAANIGFHVCDTETGTYVLAKDDTGVPIQISTVSTSTSCAYAIPIKLFPAHFVKLFSKSTTAATETATNQGGARLMGVMLK